MPSPFTFRTKAKGVWANFTTECVACRGEITVTNGRADFHQCPVVVVTTNTTKPVTLEQIRAALGK
jgi:hypothetical protein